MSDKRHSTVIEIIHLASLKFAVNNVAVNRELSRAQRFSALISFYQNTET